MEIYGLLLASILAMSLGFMSLFQQERDHIVRYFFATMVGASLWALGIAVFLTTGDEVIARYASSVYYSAAALIAVATLLTGLSLRRTDPIATPTVLLLLVPFISIASTLLLTPEVMMPSVQTAPAGMGANTLTLSLVPYLAYGIYFLSFFGAGVVLMMQRIVAAEKKGSFRKRVFFITFAFGTAGAIGVWFNLVLPWMGEYSYVWVGPLGLLLFVPIVYVAIVKYGLFDIKLAASRTTVYLLTLGLLAGIYMVGTRIVADWLVQSSLLPEQFAPGQTGAVDVVATLGLVFLFQPIKHFFDQITNSLFYRSRYSRETFFAQLSSVLAGSIELQPLLRRAAMVVAKTFSAEQVFFAIPDGTQMLNVGTKERGRLARADFDWIINWHRQSKHADHALVVRQVVEADKGNREMSRLLRSYGLDMVLLLRRGDDVRGIMCIGQRRSGRYATRDFSVIETIADEITIAVQNAMSLREVKLLNETLQQRIDEATKELRATNLQLRKLDESKDEFISMASHQLRTPLTSIKGYVDMMLDGDAGKISSIQRRFLTEAYVSSERMVHLINDFLDVSRLQTGKFIIDKRPVDFSKVVEQELESLRVNAGGRDLSFEYVREADIPILMLDEAKIRQVVMNFADNAIYYSNPKTVIRVTATVKDDQVIFTVKDTGIGVPEAEQAQLFTKFFRASNARKQRPDGTGVGLFLAKRVVAGHGGTIIFTSAEGKGSTFGFRLPLTDLRADDDADKLDK